MKITLHSNSRSGSVLMVTLLTGLLMGVVLASYLTLVHHQNATVARSQCWNAALAAAEAGVEEALAQLNPGTLTTNIDRSANGWALSGGSYYPPSTTRPILNGAYDVRFTDTTYPVIYSRGTISNTALKASLQRTIEVKTTNGPIFNVGIAALYNVDMKGNNFSTDSYNSTNGAYNPKTARANGDVASVSGVVNVNNANIRGDVLTGPSGTNSMNTWKNNGLVGDMTWKGPGIQTDHYSDDFNVDFPIVSLPPYSWQGPTAANTTNNTINSVNYQYVFRPGGGGSKTTYATQITGLSKPIYIFSNTVVNLYITGNVKLTGSNPGIVIEKGGALNIYMGGASFDLGGQSILNENKDPSAFMYFGLPSNTSISLFGGSDFYGGIYAPQADFTMNGGANFYGATVTRSATMTGNTSFHYDEALASRGPMRGYVAVSWREL